MRVFCGKCGKELPDLTKFCPYCGEQTPAALQPGAPGGNFGTPGWNTGAPVPPPVRNAAMPSDPNAPVVVPAGIGACRILLILFGIAQVAIFFLAPFGILRGGSLGSFASGVAGWFGYDIPTRLNGLNLIRLAPSISNDEREIMLYIGILILPVILSGVVFVINCAGRGRGSYIASIVLSILTVPVYFLMFALVSTLYAGRYEMSGFIFGLLIVVALAAFAFSIVGCAADPRVKRQVQQYP